MRNVALFIWTAGYSGLFPVGPGTAGSLVGLGLLFVVRLADQCWLEPLVIVLVLAIGGWSATVAERHYSRADPSEVVVDEVVGMLLTLLWIPVSWTGAILGFAVFRVFDIVKPFPVGIVERLPGGWGVMADDVVAGFYAYGVMRVILWLAPSAVL